MFEQDKINSILDFYKTRDRWNEEILKYRMLAAKVGKVKNVFFGDSITNAWKLNEFFPNTSLLNRGLGGDNVYGLYYRLQDDVLAYSPEKVFMMIGINGIEEPQEKIENHILALQKMMSEKGISVYVCSILPLRYPDNWDRFQYQDKIVSINKSLEEKAGDYTFIDYHSALKDEDGQLKAEYAMPDGTHLTFEAYIPMSEIVAPHLA